MGNVFGYHKLVLWVPVLLAVQVKKNIPVIYTSQAIPFATFLCYLLRSKICVSLFTCDAAHTDDEEVVLRLGGD